MRLGLGLNISKWRGRSAGGPANTVAPVISGTAERGEELSSTTGTWTGTGTITYAYQWLRNGAEIAGATASTYTPVAADDNTFIRCRVTATDDEGSRSAFSNTLGPVLGAPLNLTTPVLSGTETVGEELSVTNGTWQGQATITFAYQWRRDGSNISGATSSTYTLVAADYDAVIDCVVTATNSLDSASADSNDTGAIAGLAPTNDTAPSIAGDDSLGDTLTRTAGSWSGTPTPSVSGQWRRNGVAISGETGATYTIVAADSGADIDYLETATNAVGSATQDSNDITVQTFASPTIGAGLSIAGTEEVGETLTATAASVTGNPTPTRTWQWQRSDDGSTGWADISGATNSTYLLDAADEGNFVRVKQIETNVLGSDEAVSAASGEIQAGGATGLLDSYKGSAFAMSPDTLLYSTYSATDDVAGSVTNGDTGQFSVTVYRDSDNAMRSFTPAEVADGTANTWREAAGAANGLVRRAYDQSVTALDVSNLNHANQTTTANMPKLFDSATGLILENGKAAMDFDGNNDRLVIGDLTFSVYSFFAVMGPVSTNNNPFPYVFSNYLGGTISPNNTAQLSFASSNITVRNFGSGVNSGIDAGFRNHSVYTSIVAGANSVIARNNTVISTDNNNITNVANQDFYISGTAIQQRDTFIDGKAQSLILYPSDQSTNRTAISGLLNTEYNNIY
jgi:hypothetical protein